MNQQLVKQLLEQLQQETKDPTDIGKLNIPNTILWMKTNAYEQTTIKRVAKELRHLERNYYQNKTGRLRSAFTFQPDHAETFSILAAPKLLQ